MATLMLHGLLALLASCLYASQSYLETAPNGSQKLVEETVKTPAVAVASKQELKARNAPPVQVFDVCEYNEFYLDLLREMNSIRYGSDDVFSLCMNRRLMLAAKMQSDFQSIIGEPTHSGPRGTEPPLGSLEERIVASGFEAESGIVKPEEVVYYWPHYPSEWEDKKKRRAFLRSALMELRNDPSANATLSNPGYRFFGAAITRKPDGQAFLTLLMADSKHEQCHVCKVLANGKSGVTPSKPPPKT